MVIMMKKYASIIFIDNSQDFDDFENQYGIGIDAFFGSGTTDEERYNYLMQWETGDNYGIEFDENPAGKSDQIFQNKGYIMSYNRGLGYAGLVRVFD